MTTWDWAIDGWIVVVGVLSACSCALLGNYLVLRKLSLMGDAISHAVLPGLAIAFLVSQSRNTMPMFVGAVAVGALTAVLTETITRFGKVEHGAAMGVAFSMLFALGLILIRQAADHVDLDPGCVLYGNIVQIPLEAIGEPVSPVLSALGIHASIPPPAKRLLLVLVLNIAFVTLFYKELKISAFDPELSTAMGIRSSVMHYALMIAVAVTTVANFEAVGSILVIAMLIVPAVTAHLLTDRLIVMLVLSMVFAGASAVVGHWLAIRGPGWFGMEATVNTAAMMTVVAGAWLGLTILASPTQGVLARVWNRTTLTARIVDQDILGLLYRWHERAVDGGAMPRCMVLSAIGGGRAARASLRRLRRRGHVALEHFPQRETGLRLTSQGQQAASSLVGSHRLWEAYLAKHFDLPPDHLHSPAERMEHFITPNLREELRRDLSHPTHDPQGKPIPRPE